MGNALIYGLMGLYLVAVVLQRNATVLVDNIKADAPGFLPWIVSIVIITALASNKTTKPIAAPFAVLLVLNLVLAKNGTIANQLKQILTAR